MIGNWRRPWLCIGVLGLAICSTATADAETLVLRGATVYATPDAPLQEAVVVASDGIISAVGKAGDIAIPSGAQVIDCAGKTVVAGFWNSHVHFTEAPWKNAGTAPAPPLQKHMQEMLTKWGFTTVWDLGSDPGDLIPLRRRIASGEVLGPQIMLAGSLFPENGHPVYLPAEMKLPEAPSPDVAARMARQYLDMGLDGIKLFTGSYMGDKPVINMETAIAKAAVDVAHGQGKPVFAHPQNPAGVETVVGAGVDVMAHTIPGRSGYTAEQLAQFKRQNTALIPTLALFTTVTDDRNITALVINSAIGELKAFSENGGPVLFGTDVGFTRLYDTTLEYELMHRALSERQVLASLTTNPARFFKAENKGKIEKGFAADLVVLDGDPIADVRNLAKVAYTIRGGTIIYQKP